LSLLGELIWGNESVIVEFYTGLQTHQEDILGEEKAINNKTRTRDVGRG
jgi:hypothetical protein